MVPVNPDMTTASSRDWRETFRILWLSKFVMLHCECRIQVYLTCAASLLTIICLTCFSVTENLSWHLSQCLSAVTSWQLCTRQWPQNSFNIFTVEITSSHSQLKQRQNYIDNNNYVQDMSLKTQKVEQTKKRICYFTFLSVFLKILRWHRITSSSKETLLLDSKKH